MRGLRIVAAIVLCAPAALAQPTDEDKSVALTLFRRGRELMEEKRIDEACASFAESQRLDPGGGTLLNLALCHEAQGRSATAWAELSDALALARRDQRSDRIDLAREHMSALEPRLSRLVIVPPRDVEVRIVRNGSDVPRAAFGLPIPVDPGRQIVEAYSGSTSVFRAEIEVAPEGDRQTVEVIATLPPPAPPMPTARTTAVATATPAREKQTSTRAIVAWSLAGAGALSIGTGTFFGIRALDERAASDDACRANRCTSEGVDHNERAKSYADVSTATIGIGVVAVAAGVVLLLLDRR